MTFDEIFQQYVAQGFTKPTENISGIETLVSTDSGVAPIITDSGVAPIIPVQEQGGGDGLRGVGLFGNLDPSTRQTIMVDTYSDVLGPPGAFEFSPTEIEAYRNINSGLLQDYRGKNVQPMFSNTGTTFGLAGLFMKMMGMQPNTVGGFVPNSYRGYFDTPRDFINKITGETKRAEQQKTLEEAAAAKRNIQQYTGGGGGGRDRSPSQRQREAGPGFSGSGSAAEMGSF
jgi:hypothetical protein